MALSIIAHLLERAEQTSSNEDECVRLLHYMVNLAKHMKDLKIHLQRAKFDGILSFIVKGTLWCAQRMETSSHCRFISAPLDAADIQNLKSELVHLYPDLELEALTEVLNRQQEVINMEQEALNRLPVVPEPSQGEYPHDAVGVDAAQNEVMELLNLKDESIRVVVIYGVGGIGKTTLANAIYSCLPLTDYHHCKVSMDHDCNERDLPPQQKQILHNRFKENWELNQCNQGREKLSEAFEKASQPIFLLIDNILKQTNLEKLLPMERLSRLPKKSRILVTTRSLHEARIFHHHDIKVHPYRVDSLPEPEAKRVLCHYALGDKNGSFDPHVNIKGFLQFCGGIPLVLKIVGSHVRSDGNTVLACNRILEYLKEWQQKGFDGGEEDLGEIVVDFVYGRLKENCKETFLDVAFFFYNWQRNTVSDILGEKNLKDVEATALVTCDEKGKMKVHDIVRARGRWLSKGNRVNNKESWSIVVGDPQKPSISP